MLNANATFVSIPDKIAHLAATTPSRVCLTDAQESLTYEKLAHFSQRLACALLKRDITGPICLVLPQESCAYVAELGIMASGLSYIPLGKDYPLFRIKACLEDAASSVILTTQQLKSSRTDLLTLSATLLTIEELLLDAAPAVELPTLTPETPTLYIYTSGSTGHPKGICLTQGAIVDHITLCPENLPAAHFVEKRRKIMAMTQLSFVAALFNFMALYNGGTACLPAEEEFTDLRRLSMRILRENITGLFATTSFFANFYRDRSSADAIGSLQILMLGGEKLDTTLVKRIQEDFHRLLIVNNYGCSETCGPCVAKLLAPGASLTSVGRPLYHTKAYVVGSTGTPLPPNEKGELVLTGSRIAAGYIGSASSLNSAFAPFAGERAFRTGDIAYLTEEGEIELCGRTDDMVKLHGQRIELGEIESALLSYPGTLLCKAVVKSTGTDTFLAAYYTAEKPLAASALAAHLKERLPGYMVPGLVVKLAVMPLTANGKIDRIALRDLPLDAGENELPATELEGKLCAAFATCLGRERYGATTNFFASGGTSLSIAALVTDLAKYGYMLSYNDIYEHNTPRLLAELITKCQASATPRLQRDVYPLTHTQYGVYREVLVGANPETYTITSLMAADASVTPEKLRYAVEELLRLHPYMKYVIREDAQHIPHAYPVPEAVVKVPLYEGTEDGRLEFAQSYFPVIPIRDSLLFHFAIYRTSEKCYLLLKTHMIFLDATANKLLLSCLNAILSGAKLTSLDYGCGEVALSEEAALKEGQYAKSKQYFLDLFQDMEMAHPLVGDLNLPLTAGASRNTQVKTMRITPPAVRTFCAEKGITENAFFLATLALTLQKYLGKERISFSTVYNGRTRAEELRLIGTMIKRIPVYGDFSKDRKVEDYLRSINKQIVSTMGNALYPFDEILKSNPVNEDVEFLYQGKMFTDEMSSFPLHNDPYYVEHYHTGMVTGCLSLGLFSSGDTYSFNLEYRHERFSKEWVLTFGEHFFLIAEQLLTAERLSDIVMLTEEEKAALDAANATTAAFPFVPVATQIHQHALLTPTKCAVYAAGRSLSYEELDLLSTHLAMQLLSRKVKQEELIAVQLPRTVWSYVAECAILKAGCAFVPFAADCPAERLSYCLDDAKIRYLVTTEELASALPSELQAKCRVLTLEQLFAVDDLSSVRANPTYAKAQLPEVKSQDLAYCIYTSGSTGKPKGVLIEQGNLANYVEPVANSPEILHYGAQGRVALALAAFSFDLAVVEAFVPLCNGGTVVIATEEEIAEPALLAQLILEYKVNAFTATPSFLQGLLALPVMAEALRQITFYDIGAEAFPPQLYNKLRQLNPYSVIMNVYGPTECTMGCSAAEITATTTVTAGRPNANTTFSVVDTFANPLPAGIRGELVIAGAQVGRGYVNRPSEEAKAFRTLRGVRSYYSGDIAEWSPDYNIIIHGRRDSQVKLRGYRIELDEIEQVMQAFSGVTTAAAIILEGRRATILAGFYSGTASRTNIQMYLQQKLPPYMVPSLFINLPQLPLTPHGKIDRQKLAAYQVAGTGKAYVRPHNEVEACLVATFAKVLELPVKTISATDDFFALGGNSLSAMAAVATAKLKHLAVSDLYRYKTPVLIAEALAQKEQLTKEEMVRLNEEAKARPYNLCYYQRFFLDYNLAYPTATVLTPAGLFRYDLTVDADRLCAAVNTVLHHHGAFATRIAPTPGVGEITATYESSMLREVKVEYLAEDEFQALSATLYQSQPLIDAPLYCYRVFRTEKAVYLYLLVQSVIADAISIRTIISDILAVYEGKELETDYLYYYLTQKERLANGPTGAADSAYFHTLLDNTEWVKHLERDVHLAGALGGYHAEPLTLTTSDLRKASTALGTSINILTQVATCYALRRLTGMEKFCFYWTYANRSDEVTSNIVWALATSLPLGLDLSLLPDLATLIKECERQVKEGIAHSNYLYRTFTDPEPLENNNIDINFVELGSGAKDALGGEYIPLPPNAPAAVNKFFVCLNSYGEALELTVSYSASHYSEELVQRFATAYIDELTQLVGGMRNEE